MSRGGQACVHNYTCVAACAHVLCAWGVCVHVMCSAHQHHFLFMKYLCSGLRLDSLQWIRCSLFFIYLSTIHKFLLFIVIKCCNEKPLVCLLYITCTCQGVFTSRNPGSRAGALHTFVHPGGLRPVHFRLLPPPPRVSTAFP